MTRTLLTADLHLSANRRDAYRVQTMRRLVKFARAQTVGQTIILGDLTEEKDRHGDWLVNQIVEIIKGFSTLGPVYILQGNHDYYSDPECPFFGFLRHMPQVRWIGKPVSTPVKGLGRVLWLPHTRNSEKEWAELPFNDHALFFAHSSFVGADMGNGRRLDGGCSTDYFPSDAVVYSGDVHIPQTCGPVEYVGAPYAVDFGDAYEPRAIILDGPTTKTNLSLANEPQKRLIEVDAVEELLRKEYEVYAGDMVKVRVNVPRKSASEWPEMREVVKRWAARRGAELYAAVPIMIEKPGRRLEVKQADVKDDETIMREFARHRGVGKATLRRGEKLL